MTFPNADGAYFAVSALRTADGKRLVIGGSDDLTKVEEFLADKTRHERGWTAYQVHAEFTSFAHAIRVIENKPVLSAEAWE